MMHVEGAVIQEVHVSPKELCHLHASNALLESSSICIPFVQRWGTFEFCCTASDGPSRGMLYDHHPKIFKEIKTMKIPSRQR